MEEILKDALENIELACDFLHVSKPLTRMITSINRVVEVNFLIKRDNGEIENFTGYRSQHNNLAGPYKGGLRFHQNVSLDEVKALSIWMTLKCRVAGLPFGGGKGGIAFNPNKFTENEIERITRAYTCSVFPIIGDEVDIMAPDVNTSGKTMTIIMDEYNRLNGKEVPAIITGKPVEFGGSLGRVEATGFGVAEVALRTFEKFNIHKDNSKIIIQGFGNVASHAALYLYNKGCRIMSIAGHFEDEEFAIFNTNGINILDLIEFRKTEKDLRKFQGVEIISIDQFWAMEVDLLIPAALENVITESNSKTIGASIIVEGANGPISAEADKILSERNVFVVPDVLANSGGVIVSYYEWVQNKENELWTYDEVIDKELNKINYAFDQIWDFMIKNNLKSMRKAAYIYAVSDLIRLYNQD